MTDAAEGTIVNLVQFGRTQPVTVPAGSSVAEVLAEAGVDPESTIRLRGETVDGSQRELIGVTGGESIVVAPAEVAHG